MAHLDNEFLDIMYKAQTQKQKKIEWEYVRLRSFCTAKETNQYNGKTIYYVGEHIC